MPNHSNSPFAVSTKERMPSDSMPALPEKNAAVNFEAAMIRFAEIATIIALRFL
jgi:hypothetical protein